MWTPDYDGKYEVWMWDRSRAVKMKVAEASALEEAARMYDQLVLAQYPDARVDTNYAVTAEHVRATGAVAGERNYSRVGNSCALRLLQLESRVGFVCLRATSAEFRDWKQRVWEVFATKATTPAMAAEFAGCIKWFAGRIRDEVLFKEWVEKHRERHQAACDDVADWGKKEQLWSSSIIAPEGADDVKTCCSLLRALEADAICFKAAKDIADGGDGVAALEAGEAARKNSGARPAAAAAARSSPLVPLCALLPRKALCSPARSLA